MPTPLISIIMPAYKCEAFLSATLDSVLAQSIKEWECVIVDDGSPDTTAEIAQHYVDRDARFCLIRQSNAGPSAARNHGFRACSPKSRFVTFMDSDDLWLPDALQTLVIENEKHPECIGAHGLADYINAYGEPINPGEYADIGRKRLGYNGMRLVQWNVDQPTSFAVLINGNVLFPPGLILTKREAYDKAGLFDETFKGPEDWDMLIRLSRYGDFHFVNKVVLLYRRHGANLGAVHGIAEQAWRVRCKGFFSAENTPEQQRIAKGGWRAYQIRMMQERIAEIKQHFREHQYSQVSRTLIRIPVHGLRYLRGYPLPIIR